MARGECDGQLAFRPKYFITSRNIGTFLGEQSHMELRICQLLSVLQDRDQNCLFTVLRNTSQPGHPDVAKSSSLPSRKHGFFFVQVAMRFYRFKLSEVDVGINSIYLMGGLR